MKTFFQVLIPALWLIWLIIWIVAAFRAKATQRQESFASRLTHYVPMAVGAVTLGWPHILGPAMDQRFHAHTFGWFLVGLTLVVVGLAFAVTARLWLGANWSGAVTLKKDHELIVGGPYALVRHPIYTGALLALAGTAIAVGRYRALIALVVLLAGILIKISVEERFMHEQFGDAYDRYRLKVKALIPCVV